MDPKPIQEHMYGDNYRWFVGTVVNAHPPPGLEGRVKVRINGVHSPSTNAIPERDLPWAQVLIPTTEHGVSGYGRVPQLNAGAYVFGCFLDGISSQLPLVLGSLPRTELPTSIQQGKIVDVDNAFSSKNQRFQNVVATTLKDDEKASADIELRRKQGVKFFLDNGYTLLHAAAIVGSLEQISSLLTFDYDEVFTGIAKWRKSSTIGSRYSGLLNFSSAFMPRVDWRLYSVQLQFVLYELRNRYSRVNGALLSTTDMKSASEVVMKRYLRSTKSSEDAAQRAYDEVLS